MIKAALIGTGQIARQHLGCLRTLPNVEVAGVCDLSPALAESTAERFGIPAWYTDYRRLLDEVRPDVVHVTTPPPSHFPLASRLRSRAALSFATGLAFSYSANDVNPGLPSI